MIGKVVSVIIPVYNVRPYLEEALDSVVHQTYSNLEILIIDDGSTDGSERICDMYAQFDSRITVVHTRKKDSLRLGIAAWIDVQVTSLHSSIVMIGLIEI